MYKVLIVDDKTIIRKGIISSINWKGLNIELAGEAQNGSEALNSIRELKPEILITDIRMPDMNGIELLKEIFESGIKIISIVISGYDEFEYAKKAIKYGSIDYIMKPIDPVELNESLKKACCILDKDKGYIPNNQQRLREYFQKNISEIEFNHEIYKTMLNELNLEKCFFCAAMIKNKAIPTTFIGFESQISSINSCSFEEGNGIVTTVFFTCNKDLSIKNFELTVLKLVADALNAHKYEEIICGVGQVVTSADQLINSYNTAYEAIQYCLLTESQNIISYTHTINKKFYVVNTEEYESELLINITSGNLNKVAQILEDLLDKVLNYPDIKFESIRLLFRNLCYILLKLDVSFVQEINDFTDKISKPRYVLKYDSVYALAQIIYNFFSFATKGYLDETGGKNSVIANVKNFIEKNYAADIGLNKLSNLFHMNASYLTRVFKEEEGYSIVEYITKIRVDNAKKILKSGKVNVQKLAETVGYEDSTYFFKVFKKATGMTPREYLLNNENK